MGKRIFLLICLLYLIIFMSSAHALMSDLGTLGGSYSNSQANGINNSGQVVGYGYTTGDSSYYAFLYTPDTPVPIPPTVWIFGSALVGLIGIRKRIKS